MFHGETSHLTIGKIGEDLAEIYLKRKGYQIIQRNFREKFGEIDIIAKAPDKTLVFFEIKTLKQNGNAANSEIPANIAAIKIIESANNSVTANAGLTPEDNLTTAKLKKLKRVCEIFANSHQELILENKGWQVDLLALIIDGEDCFANHYENVY